MQAQSNRIHPLVAIAALSVIGVSALGAMALVTSQSSPLRAATPEALVAPQAAALVAPLAPPAVESAAEVKPLKPVVRRNPPRTAPVEAPAPYPVYRDVPRPIEAPVPAAIPVRADLGTVSAVRTIKTAGDAKGIGAVAGGVIGGVIGNQIGKGHGRDAARILGAIGGAVAGHQVERQARSTTHYMVDVRFDDQSVRSFSYDAQPQLVAGERVRIENDQLRLANGAPIELRAAIAERNEPLL